MEINKNYACNFQIYENTDRLKIFRLSCSLLDTSASAERETSRVWCFRAHLYRHSYRTMCNQILPLPTSTQNIQRSTYLTIVFRCDGCTWLNCSYTKFCRIFIKNYSIIDLYRKYVTCSWKFHNEIEPIWFELFKYIKKILSISYNINNEVVINFNLIFK